MRMNDPASWQQRRIAITIGLLVIAAAVGVTLVIVALALPENNAAPIAPDEPFQEVPRRVVVPLHDAESHLGFRPLVPDYLPAPLVVSNRVWVTVHPPRQDGSNWADVMIAISPPSGGPGIQMVQSSGVVPEVDEGVAEQLGPFQVAISSLGGANSHLRAARFEVGDVHVNVSAILGPELSEDDLRAILESLRPL